LVWTLDAGAHVTAVAVTIAFASGFVARNAGRPGFVMMQLLAASLPLAFGLLNAHDTDYHPIGYFAFLFIATNIGITLSVHRNLMALAAATKASDRLTEALGHQNITLDAALNHMVHGLAMFDRSLVLQLCNVHHRNLFELPEALGAGGTPIAGIVRHLIERKVMRPDNVRELRQAMDLVFAKGQPVSVELITVAGKIYAVSLSPADKGGILMLTEDATRRKETQARVEHMARFDELTGLANRFELGAMLDISCGALIENGHQFAVLYIDLDGFKQVNDTLGHDVGDQVLFETARRLRMAVRHGDVLARFGGDEFVLIHDDASIETAQTVASHIIEVMAAPFILDNRLLHVTASAGIAMAPEHGTTAGDLLRHADTALYKAKAGGRNRFAMFTPSMADEVRDRQELESDLREACEKGELTLHYQSIIDFKLQKVTSCEALMRWCHPTRGMVPPAVFIPIAEQCGLILNMGEFAIRRACADAVLWDSDASVAVNVSPLQFREPQKLIGIIKDALLLSGLPARRLTLEVTESLLIEDQAATLEAIRELRRIGIRFSLDDFGTGYSSLGYLSTYPFSQVKIDQSFARDVTTNPASKAVIEAVCQLARSLGMQVVVEGIETDEQRVAIQLIGAERGQGYLFCRPSPAEVFMPMHVKAA
jgi:diguanylate cyclase (GGDEF)-like protein